MTCRHDVYYHDEREKDKAERIKVMYPKFKNGEATVRSVKIKQDFGKLKIICYDVQYIVKNISALDLAIIGLVLFQPITVFQL